MEQTTKNNIWFCEKCQIHYFPDFDNYETNKQCPNCNSELVETNVSYEKYKELPKTKRGKECRRKYPKMFIKCPKCKTQLIKISTEDKNFNKTLQEIHKYSEQETNVPKCPTCGSTNVNKISGAKKAAGFITVGVFSSNFGKTMECKNCGYKW